MAWTTPKTWADGDIPDAVLLNTHIRDNMNVISGHSHSGAAGDGGATLDSISTVTFANQGSTPAAPGSAKVNIFSESETLKVRAGASGAAVAISLATHTHPIAVSTTVNKTSTSNNNPTSWTVNTALSHTWTPGGGSYATSIFVYMDTYNNSGGNRDAFMRMSWNGVVKIQLYSYLQYFQSEDWKTGTTWVVAAPAVSTAVIVEFKNTGQNINDLLIRRAGYALQQIKCQ